MSTNGYDFSRRKFLEATATGLPFLYGFLGDELALCSENEQPRNRKYNVQHPVYPAEHPIWSRSPGEDKEEGWVDKSNEELRARIDERGARRGDNRLMLKVLKHLAHRYAVTREPRYAYKCAVILERYSEVIGIWPFFNQGGTETYPHDVALLQYGVKMPPHYGAFWSSWHPYDLQESHPLALAYDQIAGSGQMEKLGQEKGYDARLKIERDLLYANLAINDRYPLMYNNTEADLLEGMLVWGQALGDPELVHRTIRFGDGLRRVSYFADAFWHEGSPSYHMMITGRWALNYPAACLAAYSDPPGYKDPMDGTRFDRVDLLKRYAPFIEEAARAMQQWILPNGHYAAVHDAHSKFTTADRWDCYGVLKGYKPLESRPLLQTWAGHAVLGRGMGANQVQAHLHFSGTNGHEHYDSLNFFLWAKNKELLSETEYLGNRAWQSGTAGHNTVVVDERNQYDRGEAPRRKFSEIDNVPGVEGFWFARTHINHGDVLTDGMLRLFATDCPGLQVVEADGHRAYPADRVTLYRRTLAMVESGGEDVYFVDIFRVRGGKVHDWILHGPLQDEYAVKTSLELQPRTGKLHTWLEQLRSARTDGPWQAEFVTSAGETVRTIMPAAPGTEVILAQGPAMRREGMQTFLDVRREGSESVFVAVHEPYLGQPRVHSVKLLAPERSSSMAVVVQVELDGRTDTILSTLEEAGEVAGNGIALHGRFGYVSTVSDGAQTLYMADARSLKAGKASLASKAAYTGAVRKTLRAPQGDALNAFVTDARLPEKDLAGRLLLTTDGDGSTRGFWVKSVTRQAEDTVIAVDRDPGMSIEKEYVKLQYYPNWGIRGGLRFRIIETATEGRKI
ncbi:MAG: heparinase II/III family protein [Candidatus Latescibacter sp.]|nr:heparinase II/III family protein [Candidatus Latescibacter sp.]